MEDAVVSAELYCKSTRKLPMPSDPLGVLPHTSTKYGSHSCRNAALVGRAAASPLASVAVGVLTTVRSNRGGCTVIVAGVEAKV